MIYLMSKKSFFVILGLSVATTLIVALTGFVSKQYRLAKGFPLEFTSFNFLGSSTNYMNLLLDITFWFLVIWGIWKLLKKVLSNKTH